MNTQQALEFVREHGVVLVSAQGPAPRLTEAIAGEPIKGSWWGHAKGKQIFAVLDALNDHADILVCRLLQNKLTMVHRRLWPALAAVAHELPAAAIVRVTQEHTASGKHVNHETPFPDWLPPEAAEQGARMSPAEARIQLGL